MMVIVGIRVMLEEHVLPFFFFFAFFSGGSDTALCTSDVFPTSSNCVMVGAETEMVGAESTLDLFF